MKLDAYGDAWLEAIRWTPEGLVPAIVQDAASGRTLMMAWMNRESLRSTVATGEAVYWSRSRQRLWRKGEASGNVQKICDVHLDCDGDALLLSVEQVGGIACHTGRESCFFRKLEGNEWSAVDPVLRDPSEMYGG
jgi:phosphoribosyl-AMP cyclohydrolase